MPKKLSAEDAIHAHAKTPKVSYINDEAEFRWELLQDQMAFDKLHEGIKKFAEDGVTLKKILEQKL